MKRRSDDSRRRAEHGRAPTIPAPIPSVAFAAMLTTFLLGRATGRVRRMGFGRCRAKSWRFAGSPRGAAGCDPRREKASPVNREKTVEV
jgi:hypothetical protein